ncbi:MAG: hemerythrin domain-containing protein [Myxococcales bacterium]|nr:hemerythrin domain-containing protein [Myxococcales bacterium]
MMAQIEEVPKRKEGPRGEVDHEFLRLVMRWLDGATDGVAVRQLLEDLAEYLQRHFASEEGPKGLFETLVRDAPRVTHQVDLLREEHGELLATVDALTPKIPNTLDPLSEALQDQVHALVVKLRAHEAKEEDLIQHSAMRDIGGQG